MQKRIRNNFFNFKQFAITQEKTAMKIGIDGVLLGAWADINNSTSILDIGTGTGLLALMCAQRNKIAIIDAIEIDNEAFKEATLNVSNSQWHNRISLINTNFLNSEIRKKYNHIISNPPFYTESCHSPNSKRNTARNANNLPLDILLKKASEYLTENGKISIIYPFQHLKSIEEIALDNKLKMNRICFTYPNNTKACHRILIELSNCKNSEATETFLHIRNEENEYSKEYKELTKDFYCKSSNNKT